MSFEVGAVLEGKVTGITKFGAFVALPDGKSGLVHISEIASAYVTDVNEHVQVGQIVKVKVLTIGDDGKINLSIKRAVEQVPRTEERNAYTPRRPQQSRPAQAQAQSPRPAQAQPQRTQADPPSANQDFESRLKKFMEESDSKIANNRMYSDHKQRTRRR